MLPTDRLTAAGNEANQRSTSPPRNYAIISAVTGRLVQSANTKLAVVNAEVPAAFGGTENAPASTVFPRNTFSPELNSLMKLIVCSVGMY